MGVLQAIKRVLKKEDKPEGQADQQEPKTRRDVFYHRQLEKAREDSQRKLELERARISQKEARRIAKAERRQRRTTTVKPGGGIGGLVDTEVFGGDSFGGDVPRGKKKRGSAFDMEFPF